jgi:hypothetical protein
VCGPEDNRHTAECTENRARHNNRNAGFASRPQAGLGQTRWWRIDNGTSVVLWLPYQTLKGQNSGGAI